MAENLPADVVPDEQLPEGVVADEPAVPNLGVVPMPSQAAHRAALAAPPTAQDTAPGAYTLGGPRAGIYAQGTDQTLSAFQATHSGVSGDQAAQALKLSKATGFAPEMVAQNLDTVQQRVDQTGFEDGLGAAPVLADYAAKGPIPAALIKDDVGPLAALEQGLLDVGYAAAATKEMSFPSAETEANLLSAELETSRYEKRPSGIIASGIRQIPMLATYYGAGLLGKRVGGQAGELGANAGAMFLLNRGTLYRQIMQQMPYPETDEQGIIGQGAYDPVEYERKARIYATAGAGASAVLATGISHAVGMALPAITTRVNGLSNGIIARAFTDPATRDVIANLIGKTVETEGGKVVTGAAGWGGHTLAGALAMAIPAVVDNLTVQQALKGNVDPGKAAAAGWEAFKSGLVAAGVLSALPHVLPTVRAAGRAAMAPFDAARLDHNVEQIQAAKLPQRNPEEAEKLVGRMTAASDAPTVFVSPEAMQDPKLAAKVADATGPHAVGDAQVTGGDFAVPTEKYLVRLGGDHAALRPNVKTLEDGATPKEAAETTQPDSLVSLMAQRSWILQTEKETPERAAKLSALEDQMRAVASRGPGRTGAGRVATEEEMRQAAADYAQMKPPGQEPAAAEAPSPPAYEVPPTPKVTPDDEAMAREHIEGKTIGEIRPSYYETQARRAGERALKLATGPDTEHERILTKYAEAMDVSLDSLRNAVQGTFGADTLPQARRKLRTAETEANRLEGGRLETLKKLEGEHAINVANRQANIQQAVTHQKNGRLFADVARDIRGEMDRTEQRLVSKALDPDFLGKLSAAGPEYRDAHDALFSAVFGDNAAQHGALEPLLARMENEGQPTMFDVDEIRGLLADPVAWKDLTPAQARNFSDAVSNIRETAQRMNQIARADRLQSMREFIGQVGEEASTRKDLGAQPITRSAVSLGERALRKIGMFNSDNLKPETIFSRLGETGQQFFEGAIIKARNYKAELQSNLLRYFEENFDKPMRAIGRELAKPVKTSLTVPKSVDLDASKMNQETLAMAFLNLGTLSNEQRMLGGYGWEKQQVLDEIGKNLKPETVRQLQGILSFHDEKLWPLIRDHAAKGGVTPPKIVAQPITIAFADGTTETFPGGYFPAAPHPDALNLPSRGGDGIQNLDRFAQATVRAAFTKLRVEGAEYPVDLNWSRVPSHLNAVLHYLAYDEPVRDVGRLLRDDEFRSIVRHRVGDVYLDQLDDDLRVWARGNAGDSSRSISTVSRMFSGILRTRAVSNALGFATPIALGQKSHMEYAITSGQVSLKNGTVAMGRALIPEVWQEASRTFSELQFRSDHLAQRMREAMGGTNYGSDIKRGIDVAAFAQMDMADRVVSHWIADAAYNDALGQGMEHGDAVTYANRKVRLLMPTHNILEMAPIVRDRGFIGAVSLFRGLPSVVWQVESGLFDEAHQQMAGAIGAKAIAAAGGRYALNGARAVASIAVLHALGRFFMGHGKKEDDGPGADGWAVWAEREAMASQFSRIPLGRDIAEPYIDAWLKDKSMSQATHELISGMHAQPDVAVIYGILRDIGTMVDEGKDTPDRMQASVNTLMTAGGVGARHLVKIGRFWYDLSTGEAAPRGPFDVIGGTVYGQRKTHVEKNPFTTIQDLISGE